MSGPWPPDGILPQILYAILIKVAMKKTQHRKVEATAQVR